MFECWLAFDISHIYTDPCEPFGSFAYDSQRVLANVARQVKQR
jgi:hypothetical protein